MRRQKVDPVFVTMGVCGVLAVLSVLAYYGGLDWLALLISDICWLGICVGILGAFALLLGILGAGVYYGVKALIKTGKEER